MKNKTFDTTHKCGLLDYLAVLFIVLWSGGGFTYGIFTDWQVPLLPVVLVFLLYRKEKIKPKDFVFPLVLGGLILMQYAMFMGGFHPTAVTTPLCGIITLLFITKILRWNFYRVFLNIMSVFAIISLVFWIVDLSPSGHTLLLGLSDTLPQLGWDNLKNLETNSARLSNTLYFYRLDYIIEGLPANSGPFWEHGRFAFFLVIALFLSIINEKKFISVRNIILLLTLITTFSTAGYIAMVTMGVCLMLVRNGISWKTILLSVGMYFVIIYISQLDFMTEKIHDDALDMDNTQSRFGAMAYHFLQISRSPWIGFGPFVSKVFGEIEMSPNGLTDLMRYWGIPMALYMFYLIYRSARNFMPQAEHRFFTGLAFFLTVIPVAFPQTIMTSPFFYFIYFMAFERLSPTQNNTTYDNKNWRIKPLHVS